MLTITLLGTGSPIPDPSRAGPATLISGGADHFLVDAGRGVLMRLAAAGLPIGQLRAVLVTNLHSDHITDLNDVITTRWITTFEPTPLAVVGPVGTRSVVEHILVIETLPLQRMIDTLDYHSSPQEAAETAARARVRTLVLTHYVPSIPPGAGD